MLRNVLAGMCITNISSRTVKKYKKCLRFFTAQSNNHILPETIWELFIDSHYETSHSNVGTRHSGVNKKKNAENLAKKGENSYFVEHEPLCGTPKS